MFNSFSTLDSIPFFYGASIGLFTYCLFFSRALFFYNKGAQYAEQNGSIPKLSDVQYLFLALGITGPILAGFIPFIGTIALIISVIMFIKILTEFSSFKEMSLIKPEKMAAIGVGMGLAGLLGFALGLYRGLEDKKTIDTSVSKNASCDTQNQ